MIAICMLGGGLDLFVWYNCVTSGLRNERDMDSGRLVTRELKLIGTEDDIGIHVYLDDSHNISDI
jgi:hypothetical protein